MADKDTVRLKEGTSPENKWREILDKLPKNDTGSEAADTPEAADEKARKAEERRRRAEEKAREAEREAAILEMTDLLEPVFMAVGQSFAARVTPDMPYEAEEAKKLASTVSAVVEKYSDSDTVFKYKEEAALIIAIGLQVVPRYLIWAQTRAQQQPSLPTPQ